MDELQAQTSKTIIDGLVEGLRGGQPDADGSQIDENKSEVPPHLHDLQEADLPEQQRGLVISEIALFRERATKKGSADKTAGVGPVNAVGGNTGFGAPQQPRERGWGGRQNSISGPNAAGSGSGTPTSKQAPSSFPPPQHSQPSPTRQESSRANDPQSYQHAPEFVKSAAGRKTDEERDRELRAKKAKADEQEYRHVSILSSETL